MSGSVLTSSLLNPNLENTSKSSKQVPEKGPLKEEQYISELLAECMCQVQVALTLQPDCVPEIDDVLLTQSLQTHHLLCERAKGQDTDAQLKKQIKNSYKNVLNCSKDIPGASDQIKQGCNKDMEEAEQLFFDNFKAITRSVLERGEQKDALKVTPYLVQKKEATLDDSIAFVTKKIRNMDAKIMDFEAILEEYKTPILPEEPLTDEEYQSYFNTPQQISLQNELDQLTVQLKKLFLENREKASDITERTDVVEEEIETTLEKFDAELEVLQADLKEKETELQIHEEEISGLEKLLAPLEVEYKEIVARREAADEKIREEQQILVAKSRAALIAQSWWRGYMVRKAMKNKDKKAKGKKGKGKKK